MLATAVVCVLVSSFVVAQLTAHAGHDDHAGTPADGDYVDITTVPVSAAAPAPIQGAATGSYTENCGDNATGQHRNADNVIADPQQPGGAHHTHDYVGNVSTNAFSTNDSLAAAATTCANGDKSTYYWPVLRLQDGTREFDADEQGGGAEGNTGRILTAKKVTLEYEGNPRGKVVAMPRFLRVITGDAKAFSNGTANANAAWSCTGFENRQLKDKYPICPQGSDVVRTAKFQSCWDGKNADSANHRSHVAFTGADGSCPKGFVAIPQLVQRLVYDVDAPSLKDNGKTRPFFAVDGFPEQLHKPVTDHGDFINVFDEKVMNQMVRCINTGRTCR